METNNTTATHPFTVAGFGTAPYRVIGMEDVVYNAAPGAPFRLPGDTKPGGTCDYCGTGIRYVYTVESSEGVQFKVGSDCAAKCDADMGRQVRRVRREVEAERKASKRRETAAQRRQARADARQARFESSAFIQALFAWVAFVAKPGYPQDHGRSILWRLLDGEFVKEWALQRLHELVIESATPTANAWVGEVKKRREFDVTVVFTHVIDGYYGRKEIVVMRDSDGHELVWRASSVTTLERSKTYQIKATVKAHGTRDGRKQTEVTRVKVA